MDTEKKLLVDRGKWFQNSRKKIAQKTIKLIELTIMKIGKTKRKQMLIFIKILFITRKKVNRNHHPEKTY